VIGPLDIMVIMPAVNIFFFFLLLLLMAVYAICIPEGCCC